MNPTKSAVQTWNSLLDEHHEPCGLYYPVSGHLDIFTGPEALQDEINSWRGEPVTCCHITTFLQLYDLNITGFSVNE